VWVLRAGLAALARVTAALAFVGRADTLGFFFLFSRRRWLVLLETGRRAEDRADREAFFRDAPAFKSFPLFWL
jgi:hypothetical protein